MKKLFLFCFAACLCGFASAQKVYFMYLQSDDRSPFYVKMGDKIHSSANSGYLILPHLTDSIYNFSLGFAKSTTEESKFSVTINQNDKGYIIKNFEEGLALFDLQDLSLVKSNAAPKENVVYETKSDQFSSLLSKAADDPSLLKVPVAKKAETSIAKAEEKTAVATTGSEVNPVDQPKATATNTQTGNDVAISVVEKQAAGLAGLAAVNNEPAQKDTTATVKETVSDSASLQVSEKTETGTDQELIAYKPSVVTRYSESSTTEGFGVVYFDKKEDAVDTIRILIPAPKVRLTNAADTAAASALIAEQTADSNAETAAATQVVKTGADSTVINPSPEINSINSSCKNNASDKDFLKLRKKMASQDNDDAMLDEARKEFRNKCYSVEQVRYLSTLFLTSASKYRFFDIAYDYVSDKSKFPSLGDEIKDEYYAKRFKALIGE